MPKGHTPVKGPLFSPLAAVRSQGEQGPAWAQLSLTPTCTPKCACLACMFLDTAACQGCTEKMTFSHQTIKIDFAFKTINWVNTFAFPFSNLVKMTKEIKNKNKKSDAVLKYKKG